MSKEFTPLWTTFDFVAEDGSTIKQGVDDVPAPLRRGLLSMFRRQKASIPSRTGPPVKLKSHHTIGRKELSSPSGVAIFADGRLLAVGDERNNRVAVLDLLSGALRMSVAGTQAHTLTHPRGVAVVDAGEATGGGGSVLFVVAVAESKVRSYKLPPPAEWGADSPSPPLLHSSTGSGDAKLKYAEACVLLGGKLFVADTEHHRVVAFETASLSFVGAFGRRGSGREELKEPRGLCALPCATADELLIADTMNDRLVQIRTDGAVLQTLGGSGSKAGLFSRPVGVAASAKAIYVSEVGNGRLQVLTHAGAPMQIISFGRLTAPPPMGGLCCGAGGLVCVVTGDKVRVFIEVC